MGLAFTAVVLPLISFGVGLASLFIDPKEKGWVKKAAVILLLLLSAGGTAISSVMDGKDKDQLEQQVSHLIDLENSIASNVGTLLEKFGYGQGQIQRSLKADVARETLLQNLNPNANGNIKVIYYPKSADGFNGKVVMDALRAGGFNVITGAGNPSNSGLATNAVWVGDNVSLDQAKFVALTLVRAGVPINSIRKFKDPGGPKANQIEIGTDQSQQGKEAFSVQTIQSLTQIQPRGAQESDLAK